MASRNLARTSPRAVPILVEKRGKLTLHEDGLREIFMNPKLKGKRICIISISGSFRKGKSFMLNFFLRYLRNKGHNDAGWMGRDDAEFNDGFVWKGGAKACTSGIMIWNEIFFATKNGEEVAILLMDTQGLFDGKTDRANNSRIFAMSTLLSSVQIFNLSQQIQDNDLEYLQYFTDYARAAQNQDFDVGVKPFQTLTFLIRDWPHAEETGYGTSGGKEYLSQVLGDESRSDEVQEIKRHLMEIFEETNCCLLPYPGSLVAQTQKASFCLRLRDVDMHFICETAQFVNSILHPDNLVVKSINGRPVEQRALMEFVCNCVQNLTNGSLPTPKNMMENIAGARNLEAQQECLRLYSEQLTEVMGNSFLPDELLLDIHHQASVAAYERYREMTRLGGDENRRKHRQHLEESIQRDFGIKRELNNARKTAAEYQLMKRVQDFAEDYKSSMNNITDGEEYVEEEQLDNYHTAFSRSIFDRYEKDELTRHSFSSNFREQLQGKIERSHRTIQSDNIERREIAEEQNQMTQELLRDRIEIVLDFRRMVSQRAQEYMDPIELRQLCETEKRDHIDRFKLRQMARNVPAADCVREEKKLDNRLRQEIETFNEINKEKEEQLLKYLESEQAKAAVQYEAQFQTILEGGYLEHVDLRQQHDELVVQLLADQRTRFTPSQLSLQHVREHLSKTKDILEARYSDVEDWNKKNYSLLGRVFKVVKEYIPSILSAGVAILGLVL